MNANALVYCENEFGRIDGKVANGLARYSEKYNILGIIDSTREGLDAGEYLDGVVNGIPVFGSQMEALRVLGFIPELFIYGIAPLASFLDESQRNIIFAAMLEGMDIVSGLPEFLSDDVEFIEMAVECGIRIHDIRKPPPRNELHSFSGDILNLDTPVITVLGDDPQEAADRFAEYLKQVRRVNPQSKYLYSSQLKLASYTRDVLRQPAVAARRLESMLMDLDMPLPGVALVRLSLGECYLAAGDTTRGRIVLTRLGRDPKFRKAGGHAHYHLARLDLAQGNLVTARDRFAVVAMDNPAAPYANDALELGLAITEEMDNPSGGPDLMLRYSQSVNYDLVADPDRRVAALEQFITDALIMVDMEEPQHLLERARFELATAYGEQGRPDEAVALFKTIVLDHPRGRFPAESLMSASRLQQELGRDDLAKDTLQLLLSQYPDYLFIDDARDAVRSLP